MHVLGFSSAIESVISAVAPISLPNQNIKNLIFDGITGFVECALLNDKPFGNSSIHLPLKWLNRGDEKAFAIYVYKYIKVFLSNGIHLTIVNCVSDKNNMNANFSVKKNNNKLRYSKNFSRPDASQNDVNKFKVKILPTFHLLVIQQVLSLLATEFPQKLSLINTPVEASFVLALAQKQGIESTVVISNNADFYICEEKGLNLCRFYGLSVTHESVDSLFQVTAKVAKSSDTLVLLMHKWKLEAEFELYLTLSLMKNDFTEDSDVKLFVGDIFNFEKAASLVREYVDLLKGDETISTQDQIVNSVIEKAYKNNQAAIDNSLKAFNVLNEQYQKQQELSTDENVVAQSFVPEFVNSSTLVATHLKKGDAGSFVQLLNTFRVSESVDALSCSSDNFSPEELWYPITTRQVEYALLSNASPFKINSTVTSKSFENHSGGKIEAETIQVRIAQQEKGTYTAIGSEKVHTFNRDYAKYEVSDLSKGFIQLWIPEGSQSTVEEYEAVLKNVPAVYQPFVIVLTSLYHLLCAMEPKPKADFVFFNEIIFASLFLDQPLSNVEQVTSKLNTSDKIYNEKMSQMNQFVNTNYYRFHSYLEAGLLSFFNSSEALGWFSDAFTNFTSALLINGTYSAYLRSLFNEEPTTQTLINAIPESNRAAYAATKEAIRSLATKEVSQHFWLEDADELLNTKIIYASNIPFSMKASDFYKLFEGISLKKVFLKSSTTGTGHGGRGTLEFEDCENMKKALVLFNRLKFEDRYLHLAPSSIIIQPARPISTITADEESPTSPSSEDGQWTKQNAPVRGGTHAKGKGGLFGTTTTTTHATTAPATTSEEKKRNAKPSANNKGRKNNTGHSTQNVWGALLNEDE